MVYLGSCRGGFLTWREWVMSMPPLAHFRRVWASRPHPHLLKMETLRGVTPTLTLTKFTPICTPTLVTSSLRPKRMMKFCIKTQTPPWAATPPENLTCGTGTKRWPALTKICGVLSLKPLWSAPLNLYNFFSVSTPWTIQQLIYVVLSRILTWTLPARFSSTGGEMGPLCRARPQLTPVRLATFTFTVMPWAGIALKSNWRPTKMTASAAAACGSPIAKFFAQSWSASFYWLGS